MSIEDVVAELRERHALDCVGAEPMGGGSINSAYRVQGRSGRLFVKVNRAERLAMFEAEAAGLAALRDARVVAVPEVEALGATAQHAYLALGWIELVSGGAGAEARLGRELAELHAVGGATFGWFRDNTIGATPQPNVEHEDWVCFWREQRLGYQSKLAVANGLPAELASGLERLSENLESWFGDYRPEPSLLHGDLWGGNWGSTADGTPYLFDPAVYFGDREADLAMTRLFGGFGAPFYAAYEEHWPLAEGAAERVTLYNLYHLLNHFNLFGSAYLPGIAASLERLGALRAGLGSR